MSVCVCLLTGSAGKLFNLCDDYADNAKKKAHIWPLQNAALILCPVNKMSIVFMFVV